MKKTSAQAFLKLWNILSTLFVLEANAFFPLLEIIPWEGGEIHPRWGWLPEFLQCPTLSLFCNGWMNWGTCAISAGILQALHFHLQYSKSYFEILDSCFSSLQTDTGNIHLENVCWCDVIICGNDFRRAGEKSHWITIFSKYISVAIRRLGVHLAHKTISVFIPSSAPELPSWRSPHCKRYREAKRKRKDPSTQEIRFLNLKEKTHGGRERTGIGTFGGKAKAIKERRQLIRMIRRNKDRQWIISQKWQAFTQK